MGQQPLYDKVRLAIIKAMKGMAPGKNKLPPERVLIERFRVSRSTMRTALNTLILEKLVCRTKSGDIYAFPSVSKLDHRMDHYAELRTLLSAAGEVKTVSTEMQLYPPSAEMRRRMPELTDTEVYHWNMDYHLDGKLVVHAQLEMPQRYFIKEPPTDNQIMFKDYLKEYVSPAIAYHISWINSDIRPDLASLFQSEKTVVQTWEQVFKDIHDDSVCFCRLSFHPEELDLSLVVSV